MNGEDIDDAEWHEDLEFSVGDRVVAVRDAEYTSGVKHLQNHVYEVQEHTLDLFNVYSQNYYLSAF